MLNLLKFQMLFTYDRWLWCSWSSDLRHVCEGEPLQHYHMVTQLENWPRLEVQGVISFCGHGKVSVFLEMAWFSSVTMPDCTWHRTCCYSLVGNTNILHTVWIWHPAIFICFLPWRIPSHSIISHVTKTSNMVPTRGWWTGMYIPCIQDGWIYHILSQVSQMWKRLDWETAQQQHLHRMLSVSCLWSKSTVNFVYIQFHTQPHFWPEKKYF